MNNSVQHHVPRQIRCGRLIASVGVLVALAACDAGEVVAGPAPDPDVRRVLIVDPGYWPADDVRSQIEVVVADAAHRGRRLTVWLVDSGNAGALDPVALPGGGDLRREARNAVGRRTEAEDNAREVMAAIDDALATFSTTGTGADLFGAVTRATSDISRVDGDSTGEVVVVTGGGVHQTPTLDMVNHYADRDSLLAALPMLEAPDVSVVVVGAADLRNVDPVPAPEFTETVRVVWEEACVRWVLAHCELAGDASAATWET